MPHVLGRGEAASTEQAGRIGSYRARDGSDGADVYLDLDRPHAGLVVGKRGYGKSYTLGVLAEALARADGVAPVVVDPMGAFRGLAVPTGGDGGSDSEERRGDPVPATVVDQPRIAPDALDPRSWCALCSLSPESGAGSLVWRAAREASTLEAMRETVRESGAPEADRRAAVNHLDLADGWDAFDPGSLDAADLAGPAVTVLDVSELDSAPANAVLRGVAEALYRARVEAAVPRLPWLLVDEAHAFFDGVAAPALETILTRGRSPGVSLVLATQRPAVVPDVAVSQSDLLVAHRLTAERDLEALATAQATYVQGSIGDRLPERPGDALVVDDATESVHAVRIRERDTPHGGGSPRASDVSVTGGRQFERPDRA